MRTPRTPYENQEEIVFEIWRYLFFEHFLPNASKQFTLLEVFLMVSLEYISHQKIKEQKEKSWEVILTF